MRTAIHLSSTAISQIERILNEGKRAQIFVVSEKSRKRLLIQEISTTKKFEAVIQLFSD